MPSVIVGFYDISSLFAILYGLVNVLTRELRLRSYIIVIVFTEMGVILVNNLMFDLLVFEIKGPLA